jgi:cytochrome b561
MPIYTRTARVLHWTIAILVFFLIGLGLMMTEPPFTPAKFELYKWHKTLGLLALALMAMRILWRLRHRAPSLPEDTSIFQRTTAYSVHFGLYATLLLIPISGWLMTSAANFPNLLLGGLEAPRIVSPNKEAQSFYNQIHVFGGYGLMGLMALHIGAALFHQFVRRDQILRRMLWAQTAK